MAYQKPNILDPAVPGGDSIREAIDKNDDNVDYIIQALNQHNHDGEHGSQIPPDALPDDIAYLPGADFTGAVTAPSFQATDRLATLNLVRWYQTDDATVFVDVDFTSGALRFAKYDDTGPLNNLEVRINDSRVMTEDRFVSVSGGQADAGMGVLLNGDGLIDSSMLDVGGLKYVGPWTPVDGAEYPDTTGVPSGSFWLISNVDDTNGYTFQGGDLAGQTAYNSDSMIWGDTGWYLKTVSVDPDMYYRLDGNRAITADFQAGGYRLTHVAEPTQDDDAATKYYVDNHGGGGGGISPINDPQPGDFAVFVSELTLEGMSKAELEDFLAFFKESEFINSSTGASDANRPIKTNASGYIDKSLLDITVFYFVTSFQPTDPDTGGVEYPDPTGENPGAFWDVVGVDTEDGYTFKYGDLAGSTAYVGDLMIWGSGGWALREGRVDPDLYYRLDGQTPITAPFAGGGQRIANIADASNDGDAVTKRQLDGHNHAGLYLPIDGTAVDSDKLGGQLPTYYATATHSHDGTYARLDGADFTGSVTVRVNFQVEGQAYFWNIPNTGGIPQFDDDLVTKAYVDALVQDPPNLDEYARLDGATFTGIVNFQGNANFEAGVFFDQIPQTSGTPTYPDDLVTKDYVDNLDIDAPVESVNGKTGVVVLDADDVGAAPSNHSHTQYLEKAGDSMTGFLNLEGVSDKSVSLSSGGGTRTINLAQGSFFNHSNSGSSTTYNIDNPMAAGGFCFVIYINGSGAKNFNDVQWIGGSGPTGNAVVCCIYSDNNGYSWIGAWGAL